VDITRKAVMPSADIMILTTDRRSILIVNEDLSIRYARTAFIDMVASDATAAPVIPMRGIRIIFRIIFRTAETAVMQKEILGRSIAFRHRVWRYKKMFAIWTNNRIASTGAPETNDAPYR
jgi:hypothetical protein